MHVYVHVTVIPDAIGEGSRRDIPACSFETLPRSPQIGTVVEVTNALDPASGAPLRGGGDATVRAVFMGAGWITV